MPGARGGSAASGSPGIAVRPAPACHGGLPEKFSGAVLRAAAEGAVRPVRLRISQGGLTGMLRRAETRFDAGREAALSTRRRATVVTSDKTGLRIEGTNSFQWSSAARRGWCITPLRCEGACVVHEIMDAHRPAVWLSDRYSAQQGHADRQQTCLARLPATSPTRAKPATICCSRVAGVHMAIPDQVSALSWHHCSPGHPTPNVLIG